MQKAKISGVFYSIQGEGIFIGYPQIFIRFSGCNLACRYCDVPRNQPAQEMKPLELFRTVRLMRRGSGPVHSVSLTGGEPLLQADFLSGFLPSLKKNGFKTYLETNGTLPAELRKIIAGLDFIAMDIKLPVSGGVPPQWPVHRVFLRDCVRAAPAAVTFVKVVAGQQTGLPEIRAAARLVAGIAPELTMVIQPEISRSGRPTVSGQRLLDMRDSAGRILASVRVIAPIHRTLGLA